MGGECLLDVVHFDSFRGVSRPPEEAVDEHLQEVPDEIVGSL